MLYFILLVAIHRSALKLFIIAIIIILMALMSMQYYIKYYVLIIANIIMIIEKTKICKTVRCIVASRTKYWVKTQFSIV